MDTLDGAFDAALARILSAWFRRQPWLPRSASTLLGVEVVRTDSLVSDPPVVWADVATHHTAGTGDRFQLILALQPDIPTGLDPDALVGEVEVDGRVLVVFEAMAWRVGALAVVRAVMPDVVDTSVSVDAVTLGVGSGAASTVFIDGRWEIKAHRPKSVEPNPDIEVPTAVARVDGAKVSPVAEQFTRDGVVVVTLRPALRSRRDGLDLVTVGLQELFERRVPPRQAHNDVVGEIEAIGAATAEMHVAMAEALVNEPGDGGQWADALLQPMVRMGSGRIRFDRLERVLDRLRGAEDLGRAIRTHGNLHLGNLASTAKGWVPHNFEGDGRPYEELRRPISPLRDVARLVVSIGRASRTMIEHFLENDPERDRELDVLAESWEDRTVTHLVAGYTSVDAVHPLLPSSRESRDALLRIFELEHQLGRLVPEAAEPSWAPEGTVQSE